MKKEKIFIGVVAILIVLVLIGLFVLFKSKNVEIAENNMADTQDLADTENTENTTTENIIEENLSTEEPVVENNEIEQNEDTSVQVNEKSQEVQKPEISKGQSTTVNPIAKKEETTPIQQETPKPSTQTQVNTNVQQNTEEKGNVKSDTNVENQKVQAVQQNTITYKENQSMINKIKATIENNKTENMKTFGCNIIVSSSIVDSTNEFTFTEKRVIEKTRYKFGTIQIYARDYYKNGAYQYTQCFIL